MNERYLLKKFYKMKNHDELKRNLEDYYGVSNYELLLKDNKGFIYSYDDYDAAIRCVFNPVTDNEIDQEFEFGYRLYKLIKRNNYTQREFAKAIGVYETQISRYTSGKVIPNFETVMKIAKVLKCSTDELYCVASKLYSDVPNEMER